MITPEFGLGYGIGSYVYNLSKKLSEKGHDVTVISRGPWRRTTEEVVEGIRVFHVIKPPYYPFHVWMHGFFVNKLFKALESRFSVVHLHTPVVPRIHTRLPVVTTIHSLYRPYVSFLLTYSYRSLANLHTFADILQCTLLSSLEKKILKQSNKITSVSQANLTYLNQYSLKADNPIVVGNGVEAEYFKPTNIESNKTNIIYVGRILYEKGMMTLLQCAQYVLKRYPEAKFLLAGGGPIRDIMEEETRKMGIHEKILFLGRLTKEELLELYQKAYIKIIPSLYEGLPNVLLEAMSTGIPVVSTAVGGVPGVISSGVNGFLVPRESPVEMAKMVLKLLEDTNLRKKMGKAARRTIENEYTWDKVADKFLQCYHEVI
jgi:glycosyltransferase involved in cell wall biosynthesis